MSNVFSISLLFFFFFLLCINGLVSLSLLFLVRPRPRPVRPVRPTRPKGLWFCLLDIHSIFRFSFFFLFTTFLVVNGTVSLEKLNLGLTNAQLLIFSN